MSKKVKWSHYRPGVAQRVGRGIALLFHDHGTSRGWVVSSTPRLYFTPGKDPVPILQEAGWVPGPVWMGGKSRPHWDLILDRPACSQSLYRLSYSAHSTLWVGEEINYCNHVTNSVISVEIMELNQLNLYDSLQEWIFLCYPCFSLSSLLVWKYARTSYVLVWQANSFCMP